MSDREGALARSGGRSAAPLGFAWLGRVGHREAVALQEELRRRILAGDDDAQTLLLLEHDHTITLGRSARATHVLVPEAELAARGATVERSTRGGDVTYHGPGQLVAYPVLRLTGGVLAHVEALAAAACAVAGVLGVRARFRRDCPGVWVEDRKLASVGVHVHRRVTVHGLALNVTTDLDWFRAIVACGQPGAQATSLAQESGSAVALAELAPRFADAFAHALGRDARPIPPLQLRSVPVK